MKLRRSNLAACGLAALALLLGACQKPMKTPVSLLARGEYGQARVQLREQVVDNPSNRRYLLDRMRVGVLTLADGYPRSAQTVFEEVYEVLRTQGINRDRTVQSVVLNEDLKIWKGEPFEQALALAYYAMVQAELGSWDNARAAANNALFYLKDFGEDEQGRRLDTVAIAQRSLLYERAIAAGATPDEAYRQSQTGGARGDGSGGDPYLDHGYVPRPSDFTLGYLLAGVANQQLGRHEEASDQFSAAGQVGRGGSLTPLIETLRRGDYNTLLVVSWGFGPRKEGYGPDQALARFTPRSPSDGTDLWVRVGDTDGRTYPQVLDVNRMAADHMWNNLEDVRLAKATLGTGLLYGGLMVTAMGADRGSEAALYGGLGAMAAGAFLKAGAHVDVRYADVFPQRFYVVPLMLPTGAPTTIEMQVYGHPQSRLVLTGLAGPSHADADVQLRYVRLLSSPRGAMVAAERPAWATSGRVIHSNPHVTTPGPHLPYILGGRDARPPTETVLDDYQASGHLRSLTLSDLYELYRLEGIQWTVEDQGGYAGLHVLEGGRSLVSPLPGTVGFTRLFGQLHRGYDAKTREVTQLRRQIHD